MELAQHSAGCRKKRKMLVGFFWLILSGLVKESISVSANTGYSEVQQSISAGRSSNASTLEKLPGESASHSKPDRLGRSLSKAKDSNDFLLKTVLESEKSSESVQREPTKSKAVFMIPYLRPGRSDKDVEEIYLASNEKKSTIIPVPRFGRLDKSYSIDTESSSFDNAISKKHDSMIPVIRFGRSNDKSKGSIFKGVIPYPRLGRTLKEEDYMFNEKEFNDEENQDRENDEFKNGNNDFEFEEEVRKETLLEPRKQIKKDGLKNNVIIPYPRLGRRNFDDNKNVKFSELQKRTEADYVLPQIRYGRSMILLSTPKTKEKLKQNTDTFVLPYPRPGRSNKQYEKSESNRNLNVILPYPRPGRSNIEDNLYSHQKRQGYMLPTARFGRSNLNDHFEVESENLRNEGFLGLKVNPLLLNSDRKNMPGKPKHFSDSSSVFVIPYPRPGKKSSINTKFPNKDQKPNKDRDINKDLADYLLPYPRPGKKSSEKPSSKTFNDGTKNSAPIQTFVVPYPRPGRSENVLFETENLENEYGDIPGGMDDTQHANAYLDTEEAREFYGSIDDTTGLKNYIIKKSDKNFMMPYARLGRQSENILPYSHPRHLYSEDNDAFSYINDGNLYYSLGFEPDSSLPKIHVENLEYNNASHLRLKRSNSVVPYPRLGRSDSIVPYPRPGRSDSVVPYPRPGRSNSVVPYPRLGRSDSVVPYPRLGRSDSVVPYPRLGRSDYVVPYPRLGRSDSVVPYPRPGRSDSVVPYPRLGRSNVENSLFFTKTRDYKGGLILPNLRPGRSNSKKEDTYILPYPRPGRSENSMVIPYPRPGRSENSMIIPYPRPGRSENSMVIPYPRPGRSENSMVIPYPRPGRSIDNDHGYVLPYPRVGRSDADVQSNSDTVIPYPRLGRSQKSKDQSPVTFDSVHKLNKHTLNKGVDSIYILPYPRPGRFTNDS